MACCGFMIRQCNGGSPGQVKPHRDVATTVLDHQPQVSGPVCAACRQRGFAPSSDNVLQDRQELALFRQDPMSENLFGRQLSEQLIVSIPTLLSPPKRHSSSQNLVDMPLQATPPPHYGARPPKPHNPTRLHRNRCSTCTSMTTGVRAIST